MTRQIEKLASPATSLGLVSLLVFAWAATGMMAALRAGLEVAMRVQRGRPPVRGKLVDVVLIVGAAALVLVVVFLNLAQAVVFGWIQQPLDALGLDGGLLEQGIRARGAAARDDRRRAAPLPLRAGEDASASVTPSPERSSRLLLLLSISLVSGMIFERVKSLSISVVYASLTSALVFLYSVYLAASALLLGAEVAAAWSHPGPPTDETLPQQIRRVALGLFVHQEPPARPEARPRVPTDPLQP